MSIFHKATNTMAEWRELSRSPNYEASSHGEIRRIMGRHSKDTHILKPYLSPNGYLLVNLSIKGIEKTYSVHSLIAETFLGHRPENYCAHHKNEIKTDNNINNIEYRFVSDHIKHHLPGAKINTQDVITIREMGIAGKTRKEIAMIYGLTKDHIGDILNGKCWGWVGGEQC